MRRSQDQIYRDAATVAGLSEQIRELSKKVTELEIEVAALKKTGY